MASGIHYYERRAGEYDATSWSRVDPDGRVADVVRSVLDSLAPMDTLDVGCGTGYVSGWLPGRITLLDSSPAMLAIASRRVDGAAAVRAAAPSLPFQDGAVGRAFTSNFYGHLAWTDRQQLISEMLRVSREILVLDQLATSGIFAEGPESRQLRDGTTFTIHKCYFTVERLLEEIGGDVVMTGPLFAMVRRTRDGG